MGKYSSPWKSPDAQHASVHIAKVIEPEISHLVFTGGISYQSMNMSKGINASGIVPWKRLLIALLLLDPRGGHFSQAHVIMGLTIATSSPTLKAAIEKDAADKKLHQQALQIAVRSVDRRAGLQNTCTPRTRENQSEAVV